MSILNKVGKELVIELLNRDNQANFTFDEVEFGTPEKLEVTADFRNTSLLVSAKPNSKYRGTQKVNYWRLDLDRVLVGGNREIMAEEMTSSLELLDPINERFGVVLTSEDVVIEYIDTSILPVNYLLKTVPGSYGYIGSVEMTLVDSKLELAEVLPVTSLISNGYPIDPELTVGSLSFLDIYGNLLSAPGVSPEGMSKTNNGEVEIYIGVHEGTGVNPITPVAGVYDIDLADTDTWKLDFGMGLLDTSRGAVIDEMYDVTVLITYDQGGRVALTLARDEDNDLGWSVNGSAPSFDVAFTKQSEVIADTLDLNWLLDIIKHAEVNSVGGLLGNWNMTISVKPKRSIVVKPLTINIAAHVAAL